MRVHQLFFEKTWNHPRIFSSWLLFLLISIFLSPSDAFRKPRGRLLGQSLLPFGYNFEFTKSEYNVSLKENTRNRPFVQIDDGEKIGVFLPPIFSKIKFKIVDGDKDKMFIADHIVLGDFAFLQIMPEKGQILNREKKNHFELVVKATLKRKNANTLETTTKVNLKILDENDNSPMFKKLEYATEVDTNTPLNSRLIKLEAFDADEGLNAELYYSLTNPTNDSVISQFYVDAKSGWIRTFSKLIPGNYVIDCLVEDRTSRLQFYSFQDQPKPAAVRNKAQAKIVVKPAVEENLKIETLKFPLKFFSKTKQLGAKIKILNAEMDEIKAEILKSDGNLWIEKAENSDGFWIFVGKTTNQTIEAEVKFSDVGNSERFTMTRIAMELDPSTRKVEFEDFQNFAEIKINESVPIGFVIHQFFTKTTLEEDSSLVRFRIRTETKDLPFHLDRITGILKIKEKLDFETAKTYEFFVVAKLDGLEDAKTNVLVKISIQDSNDNCPQFVNFPENGRILLSSTNKGTKVTRIQASDADSGENGRIFYKIKNHSDVFGMDSETGEIVLNGKVDKKTKFWKIKVFAFDSGFPVSLSTEKELEIYANSEDFKTANKKPVKLLSFDSCNFPNKNPPKFIKVPESVEIQENIKIGTKIGIVQALDADFGINGIIQYTTTDAYFAVDIFTGEIMVKRPIFPLFDQLSNGQEFIDYKFEISASDMGNFVNSKSPILSSKITVTVRIHDVNNFAPVFESQNYFVEISETFEIGKELLKVKATDKDPGQHGKVEYLSAVDSDYISVDPDTGAVRSEKLFDRELSPKTGKFEFLLAAFDRADPSKMGFANLTVTVTDVNDNAPKCLEDVQEFTMLEDAPKGHLIGCLAASDADDGINAELNFNMVKVIPRVPFRIDPATGCLFLDATNPLSADRHSRYSFNVTVSDRGTPVLSSICQVKLDLIKVNQNLMAPEFETIAVESSVNENSPIGTKVIQVKAVDPEGKPVKYELVGGSGLGYFEIDEVTGMISTATVLDYEATASYWLTVKATDLAEFPLSGYTSVLVRVLDMNDRAPLFEKPIYFVNVEENSAENKVFLKLEAEDIDGRKSDNSDGHLRFSIIKGNTQSLFHVDANTGYLVTGKRHLDRETQREHELTVRVCDHSTFVSTKSSLCADALVVVTVDDVNDNRPLFNTTTNLNVQVPANKIGFLTRIFANDADSDGPNSEVDYSFIGPLVDERLRIDKFGRISTVEALKNGDQVHVTVLAKDNGTPNLNSSVTLILEALGRSKKSSVNNQKPRFIEKEAWKELYVSDSDPVGVIVGWIRAEDADNDPLWFSISENSQNPNETFAFKSATGELILARSVNLIDPNLSEVKLSVVVSDGIADIIDQLTIKISRSVHAPRPEFDKESDSIVLKSNSPVGMVLYTAKATFDESKTGVSHPHRLIYSIQHIDDVIARDFFRIDPHFGQLVLEKTLSFQVAKNFTIIISAKVGSTENFLQLYVTKESANEHSPRFISKNFEFPINFDGNSEIGIVKAFDADNDQSLTYSIIAGNEYGYFEIDPKSGIIKLTKSLMNNFKEAILTLRVMDSGEPYKTSTCVARIFIQTTIKTIKPIFEDKIIQIHMDDQTKIGTVLTQAKLVQDLNSIQTTLVFDGLCDYFDIHFISGLIKLKKTLPMKENDWSINCTIFALNEAGNNSTIPLIIKVSSTIEKSSKFIGTEFNTFIKENANPGMLLQKDSNSTSSFLLSSIFASDIQPKFRILSPREHYFIVDNPSTSIRLLQPLDHEKHETWEFYVTASNLGVFPHLISPPTLINVKIGNVNDVPPRFVSNDHAFTVFLPPIEGTKIGKLLAVDDDGDDITFALKTNDYSRFFSINRTTGDLLIISNKSTDFKESEFLIPVVASDGVYSTSTNVKINVVETKIQNIPTNRFKFSQEVYKINIQENSTMKNKNLLILELENSENGEVFNFELLTMNDNFKLMESSGILELIDGKKVDREKLSKIQLFIRATSKNDKTKTAFCIVEIDVEDLNDCQPEFLNLPYEVLLSEDATQGDKLISVKAKDDDVSSNSMIRYSLATDAPKYLDINKFDGRITLNSKPNMKKGDEMSFTVIATDSGKPPLESREKVIVKIANKYQPIFSHNRYHSKISESSAIGTTVLSVRANSKSDGIIGYRIADGDDGHYFVIGFNDGQVKVNKPLDREEQENFKLIIEAIDVTRNVSGTSILEIAITDVNDSPPIFEKLYYKFEILESATIGTILGEIKAIDKENSQITYSIFEGNKSVINIDSTTGIVTLSTEVDRERMDYYEFIIVAKDHDRFSSETILQLKILEVNDCSPKFLEKNPLKIVLEMDELRIDDFIHQFAVDDDDEISSLPNQRFKFSIIDGDETIFQIDPINGVLKSSTNMKITDFNGISRIMNISVSDGIYQDFITTEITIKPKNKNNFGGDLPLHFEQTFYTAIIEENRQNSNKSSILTIIGKGGISPLRYGIPGKTKLPIEIERTTGKVYLTKKIDKSLEIPVVVFDQANNKAFSKIKIKIQEENDKIPRFIAPKNGYSLCVNVATQPTESLAMIFAVDDDINDSIEYSIISQGQNIGKYFEINEKTGYLTVKQSLMEIKSFPTSYDFFIRASDSGNPPHSSQIPIHIKIVNIQQNVPQFSRLHYLFAISEDANIGKIIGQLQNAEQQHGHGSRIISFTIVSENNEQLPFSIDEKTGKIVITKNIDREMIEKYHFVVQIKSTDNLFTFAIVTVAILDVNDNSPVFSSIYDKITIREDALVGTVLANFVATDEDEGINGHVTYSLEQEGVDLDALTQFQIDREYGWLTLAKTLDRETRSIFKFKVVANDDGGKSSSMILTIEIEDVNDCKPKFGKEKYEIEIKRENLKENLTILEFDVMDDDSFNDLQLFITFGDDYNHFYIENMNLKLKKMITKEMKFVNLQVTAFDGSHSTNILVFIKIIDLTGFKNETKCQEIKQELKISGNLIQGHVISFLSMNNHPKDEFIINHLLDSEKLPFTIQNFTKLIVKNGYNKKRNYQLKILTKKEMKKLQKFEPSCFQILNLEIENANVFKPKFERNDYFVKIKEDLDVKKGKYGFLINVEAIDDDFGSFGQVKYSILNSTDPKMFEIYEKTGTIIVKEKLDREKQENYTIFVKATDGGGLFDIAKITVIVEDVNDNFPIFEIPIYRLKVLEDEAIGYELIKVKAIDLDTENTIKYSLKETENSKFVKLDSETGVLKLAKQLDYEKTSKMIFEIIAKDSGKLPNENNCTVEIEILDVNDNAPRFEKTLYETNVTENVEIGTKIIKIQANDADSEHFGKVSYQISGEDASYFEIDEEGNLMNVKTIDYEEKNLLRINVKAIDGGSPPLSDDTLVSITVIDENDHSPEFGTCDMSAIVQEGATPGHELLKISITDKDSDANAGPFKIELFGEGSDYFGFDQENRLILIKKLSFEKKSNYSLNVTATDSGGKNTTCWIKIQVKRTSSHPPELKSLIITLNTLHGEFFGGKIGKIDAYDKDSGDTLRFSMVETDERRINSKFSINAETGELFASSDLLPGLHRLNISVTDGKFIEYGRVDVDVGNIDGDSLDHAVSLRLKGITAKKFIKHFMRRFHEIISHLLSVPTTDLRFLSIQEVGNDKEQLQTQIKPRTGRFFGKFVQQQHQHQHRRKRSDDTTDLDILFTVSRGENHGYHRPSWIRQNIEKQITELSTESGLEVISLTSEVCRRDVCVKGECRDRLWLDNSEQQLLYQVDGISYISPKHLRTFECLCKQGYNGRHCDVPINVCSKELCTKHEMCIPSDEEPSGFRCVCPPGFRGSQCSESTCDDPSTCSQKAELSLMGNGYIQLFVANSMETRLELAVQFRTVSNNAYLMHGEGLKDYHSIKIINGSINYIWNCGTGEQISKINNVKVDDGSWHEFKVARRGRHVRIVLDNIHEADATSPEGSDVVNLFNQATLLTFGAKVIDSTFLKTDNTKISTKEWFKFLSTTKSRQIASELFTTIEEGMMGCFGKISFDGFELSKTSQGMKLFNTKIGCDTTTMGPCLSSPCQNNGQCIPSKNSYSCLCGKRYTGTNCEIDLNACESKPCPNGIVCHNLYNDFHCSCPAGFTGKTCQMRGDWDPCLTNPCGPYGSCIRQGASFICNCSNNFGGIYCNERIPNIISDGAASLLNSKDAIIVGCLLIVIFILSIILILCCRKSQQNIERTKKKQEFHDYDDPLLGNPLLSRNSTAPPIPPHASNDKPIMMKTTTLTAPPLPPRLGKQGQGHGNQHIYCNQSNLPTVEVRPMFNSGNIHGKTRNSTSSPCSSNGKQKNQSIINSSMDLRDENEKLNDRENYRRYAVPTRSYDDSLSSHHGSSSGINGDISSSIPLLSGHHGNLNDSIQCLQTDEIEINLDEQSDIEEKNQILNDLRKEKEKLDLATNCYNNSDEPQDYVTMKPIHKIKPFTFNDKNDGFKDIDEDSDGNSKVLQPPPLPIHRTIPKSDSIQSKQSTTNKTNTPTTKLYDNPNDDTLSNVTSNGLDD